MRAPTRRLAGLAVVGGALLLSGLVAPASAPAEPRKAAVGSGTETVGGERLGHRGVQVSLVPGLEAPPKVTAKTWLVADAGTGEVLAAKDAHVRRLPASTLKTLTALTLIPVLDPDATYTATWDDVSVEGSKVGMVAGAPYTVDQLFRALLLGSGNDAARALAGANGGMARTVRMMNEEAARLQAHDTVVRNTSGLDHPEQLTSAYDLALVARAGLEMPRFRRYVSMISTSFPGGRPRRGKKRSSFMVYNHNPLLRQQYRGAIGVKTGFTSKARRTFVGAAERHGRTLIVTMLGYEGDTYRESSALLSWGFRAAGQVEPVGELVDPLPGEESVGEAEEVEEVAAASDATSDGTGMPAWPFVAVGAPFAIVALGALGSSLRGPRTPLEAANRGRGRRRSRYPSRRY